MAESRGQGGGKKPGPVKVYVFRKPARSGRSRQVLSDTDQLPTQELPAAAIAEADANATREERARRSTEPDLELREDDGKTAAERAREQLAHLVDPAKLGRLSEKQIAEIAIFGHHLFEQGKLDEARVVFESLVGIGVKDAFPHTMLGTIYLAQGEPKLALALFEASLELDGNDLAARVYRGEIRLMSGRAALAVEDLALAVERGDDADPFVERARKLLKVARSQARKKRQRG